MAVKYQVIKRKILSILEPWCDIEAGTCHDLEDIEVFIKSQLQQQGKDLSSGLKGKPSYFVVSDQDSDGLYHILGFASKNDFMIWSTAPDKNSELLICDFILPETTKSGETLTDWQKNYLKQQEEAERNSKYSVRLNISPTTSEYSGHSDNMSLTALGYYDGKSVPIYVIPQSGNLAGVIFLDGKANVTWIPPSISDGKISINYSVKIGYDDEYGLIEKIANASQTRYAPMRWVCKPSTNTPEGDEILSGIKNIQSSCGGQYSIPFNKGDYVWLCFPAFMNPTSFTSGGFMVPVEDAKTVIVRIGDTDVSYKCIRITGAPQTSPLNIKIS